MVKDDSFSWQGVIAGTWQGPADPVTSKLSQLLRCFMAFPGIATLLCGMLVTR